MNILFVGDIVGRPGRELIRKGLRALIDSYSLDLVIANVENSAAGFGVTKDIGDTLLEWGVDVMTSGNHVWDKKEGIDYIASEPRLLRPANYPAGVPGRGTYVARTGDGRAVGVVNVMGRVFMLNIDDPFTDVELGEQPVPGMIGVRIKNRGDAGDRFGGGRQRTGQAREPDRQDANRSVVHQCDFRAGNESSGRATRGE